MLQSLPYEKNKKTANQEIVGLSSRAILESLAWILILQLIYKKSQLWGWSGSHFTARWLKYPGYSIDENMMLLGPDE